MKHKMETKTGFKETNTHTTRETLRVVVLSSF